ncbi:MAG: 30S ribosomal protein S20 [Verrucomicrobiota bacterium]|nr:30S ribosomal protein S20 [Verrucomicrobiota bacterium]
MANTKSAGKRARQTQTRTLRNRSVLTRLRRMAKKVTTGGTADENTARSLISSVDKAAKRGVIHRNAANRRKARLNKARRAASTPAATPAA